MKFIRPLILVILALAAVLPVTAQENKVEPTVALTLSQALSIAFQNSTDIRIARDNLLKSKGVVAEAKANHMPNLSAGVTHTLQGPPVTVKIGDVNADLVAAQSTTAKGSVSYPIDISGRLNSVSQLASKEYQMSRLSLVSASQSLLFNVQQSYYDVLRAEDRLKVAQSAVDNSSAKLANSRARFDAGTVPKFDVTRAEVDLANLNQTLISARNAVQTAIAVFNNVLGVSITSTTTVAPTEIKIDPTYTPDVNQLIEKALSNRPEIGLAKAGVDIGSTNVKLQRSGLRPTLDLNYVANYQLKVSGFSATNLTWTAMANLNIPIWNGGVTKAKIDQAKADVLSAQDQLDRAKLVVALDVRTATLRLQDALERVSSSAQNVTLAEEALRLANVRYDAGIATLIEVTDAEDALTQSRSNNVNAQYDYAVAVADIQRATAAQPELSELMKLSGAI